MEKEIFTMEEIENGEGVYCSGRLTMIGEIMDTEDPRRFITYEKSMCTGNAILPIGSAKMRADGTAKLNLHW